MSWSKPSKRTIHKSKKKNKRILIVTGFERDTPNADIMSVVNTIVGDTSVESKYSPDLRNNKAFIRFKTFDERTKFLDDVKSKDKPKVNGKEYSVSQSLPFELLRRKFRARALKTVLVEHDKFLKDRTEVQAKKGLCIVWIDGKRIAEMNRNKEVLKIKNDEIDSFNLGITGSAVTEAYMKIIMD